MKNKLKKFRDQYIGKRIRLINMPDDPNPIPSGSIGTVEFIDDAFIIHVKWDDGRKLGLVPDVDDYELIENK